MEYKRDGKTYTVSQLQGGVINKLLESGDEKKIAHGERTIRRAAYQIITDEGETEKEQTVTGSVAFQGPVSSNDLI